MSDTNEAPAAAQDYPADLMDKLVSLCKRRGVIFQSSEIYSGINGFYDYGPLGVEMRRNIKDAWWRDMVRNPPAGPDGRPVDIVGLDSAIRLMHELNTTIEQHHLPLLLEELTDNYELVEVLGETKIMVRKSADR